MARARRKQRAFPVQVTICIGMDVAEWIATESQDRGLSVDEFIDKALRVSEKQFHKNPVKPSKLGRSILR